MEILIITGMSGSGKSQALNAIEDMGYFCMDNLPPALLPKFCELAISSQYSNKVAVVVDLRSGKFFENMLKSLKELSNLNVNYKILFMDADLDTIIGRYKELRRPHPLNTSIVEGYKFESESLSEIKKIADYVIDTSIFTNMELKDYLSAILKNERGKHLTVIVTSFGFKKKILRDADLVFDVRFLPNPFYVEELRNLDGLNEKTKSYVIDNSITQDFLKRLMQLLEFLIPLYEKEGKSVLSIGFGCTGGFHRSVAIAEEIGERLSQNGHFVHISHRDKEANLWKGK